jgi:hypothetical protein
LCALKSKEGELTFRADKSFVLSKRNRKEERRRKINQSRIFSRLREVNNSRKLFLCCAVFFIFLSIENLFFFIVPFFKETHTKLFWEINFANTIHISQRFDDAQSRLDVVNKFLEDKKTLTGGSKTS